MPANPVTDYIKELEKSLSVAWTSYDATMFVMDHQRAMTKEECSILMEKTDKRLLALKEKFGMI